VKQTLKARHPFLKRLAEFAQLAVGILLLGWLMIWLMARSDMFPDE
jgi:hypothetical protein